ncbi:MAG: cytochrome c [Akkermansiaceae bacterium]|nr:cytochrome c [Akkermansiaceae bacterium]
MKTTRIASPLMGVCCVIGTLTGLSMAEPDKGETMTKALCMACHGDTQAGQKRLAPPMMMVKQRYQTLKKDEMVAAIVAWAKKPDAKHSRMPGAINNFGLMPPLPLPDADLQAIASYIAKTEFAMPKGCGPGAGNGQGPAAGKGQGRGRGQGQGAGRGQPSN